MAILAFLLSAGILAGCAYLPALLHRRHFGWGDCGWVLVPLCLLWLGAAAGFEKPGLFIGFGAFRLLALCGGALWLGLTLCALRCYGVLGGAKRLAALLGAFLFAALGTEVFVCNLPYFSTHGYTPVNLLDYLDESAQVQRLEDGSVRITEEQGNLYFTGMDAPLYNLQLGGLVFNYEGAQPAAVQNPLLIITLTATDDASSQEYAAWSWPVAWRAPRSWVRTLDLAGQVHSLRLSCAPYSGEYMWYQGDYTIAAITANAPRALDFSWLRLGVLWLLGLAIWALRPGSGLWRTAYLQGRKSHRLAAGLCCGVLMVAAIATPFASPVDSGVATSTYNANNWDGGSRLSFSQHINDYQHASVAQYGALAHSLLNGRLDLELDPPASLLAMENPLDTALRNQQAPDALWDVALYNGRYYVYFGVVPCLLFQLPLEAITGVQDWPPCFGMIAMAVLMLLAIFTGLKQALRRWFPGASTAAYLLGCTGIAAGSGMYYLLMRAAVYDYAILCGASFVCLALWQWLHAANLADDALLCAESAPKSGRICLHLALGSLCMALVAGCRPQLVLFAVLALPLFWGCYIGKGRLRTKAGLREAICFLLPVVLVAAGLMWYNAARFGSPFDFGANYNLTSNDMTKRGFRAGRIGPALFAAFGLPPSLSAVFPYVGDIHLATNLVGTNITEKYYGGLLWMAPLLAGLCLLPFLAKRLRRKNCLAFVLCCVVAAPLMVILDAEMAGILYRYQTDFSPVLLLGGVLCLLGAEQALQQRCALPVQDAASPAALLYKDGIRLQTLLRLGFCLSVIIGCCFAFCVVFGAEPWLYGQNPALFQNASRLIQFWL